MGINTRSSQLQNIGPGPFLAKIVNHLDPSYMGSLEVSILRALPGQPETVSSNVIVRYCTPFYSVTSAAFEGNDSARFNDVQKSSGFWMVPPDIGTTVIVLFIDGDINQGYWFGCIPDMYQNHMVPGLAASKFSAIGQGDEDRYGTKLLPVAEFQKAGRNLDNPNPEAFTKPIHPFADRLLQQGLLLDTIRGVTSSSARREVPSQVFGISTPGPIDTSANAQQGYITRDNTTIRYPVSRLGGTSFVMDDGDNDGLNELVRIRTRTGHQILLHNSSDLIYIGNSKGTAWIELTSNGKIDVYAEDSVSIHTEQDFNFRADRDINLEAGRNINVNAAGGIEINCKDRFYLICDNEGKINIGNNLQVSVGSELRTTSGAQTSIKSNSSVNIESVSDMNLQVGTDWKVTAGASSNIFAKGNHIEKSSASVFISGTEIQLNDDGSPAPIAANGATEAVIPDRLDTFDLPNRSFEAGWANGNFYRIGNITSIMQRIPTHEPWDQHENINPSQFSSSNTDVQVKQPVDVRNNPTSGSGTAPINSKPIATPSSKSSSANEAYLQAVLIQGGVTDPIKLAAWMAQCKVESDYFRTLREYASGKEYEGRSDLGNTTPGDGIKYKGRGFIQCTGKDNYRSMSSYFEIDFISQPELVEQIDWAAKSVLWFFNVYKKNRSSKVDWNNCVAVTKIVNGGTNALAKRQQFFDEYKAKFTTQGIEPSPNPVSSG